MNLEMIWLLLPVVGLFSQLGGSDYAPKSFRRIGIPVTMAVAVYLFAGASWQLIPFALFQFGAFTLPFTLLGDGVPDKWQNWAWLPVWGLLLCSPALWINPVIYPAVIGAGLVLGLFGALSNIKGTAKYFQWKFVELFIAICPAYCVCMAVT